MTVICHLSENVPLPQCSRSSSGPGPDCNFQEDVEDALGRVPSLVSIPIPPGEPIFASVAALPLTPPGAACYQFFFFFFFFFLVVIVPSLRQMISSRFFFCDLWCSCLQRHSFFGGTKCLEKQDLIRLFHFSPLCFPPKGLNRKSHKVF